MEYDDFYLVLSVAFVFMRENTAKLVTAIANLNSKYCC